jgi:hypothetical protein
MIRHRLIAAIAAVVLLIPAATAYGADQDVQVHVLPSNALEVNVDGWADFGGLEVGQTGHYDFWLNVTNTTSGGWQVDVTGGDLVPFHWEGCDENGCYNPIQDPGLPILKSNLVVAGGDLDWWDDQGDVVMPFSGTPGDPGTPLTIVQAMSQAHGEFGLDNPMAYLELTIPEGAAEGQQYHTVLTYTITAWNPAP